MSSISNKNDFKEHLKYKVLSEEGIQPFYVYAIDQYYENYKYGDISLVNLLIIKTSYLEPKLRRRLVNSLRLFIPHHFNDKKYLFAKRNPKAEVLKWELFKRTKWQELKYHKTNFPIRDERYRVNKSRRFWLVGRSFVDKKLSNFIIHDYIDRKITKIDGRSCVRWNNQYYPVHTKDEFDAYKIRGLNEEFYIASNIHSREDIKYIDPLEFIFEDESKEQKFSRKDI